MQRVDYAGAACRVGRAQAENGCSLAVAAAAAWHRLHSEGDVEDVAERSELLSMVNSAEILDDTPVLLLLVLTALRLPEEELAHTFCCFADIVRSQVALVLLLLVSTFLLSETSYVLNRLQRQSRRRLCYNSTNSGHDHGSVDAFVRDG